MKEPVWLTGEEHRSLRALLDLVLPGDDASPGAGSAGGADCVDQPLGAFSFDPPRIWAGGPFSGRHGGTAGFGNWIELGHWEQLAWRTRLEGSAGHPEREFNGPVVGWQEQYRQGLAALGADFPDAGGRVQAARWETADADWRALVFTHACESLYGDPVYGGNHDMAGWTAIGFAGDTQPVGFSDAEVEGR